MDGVTVTRKAVFFNNLLLLGLNQVTLEKKYGIPFHKDMFNLPNKKGYEVVTYFLFSKLSAVTGKDYNLPWPVFNKELDRIFQKTCYTHLVNFSQENDVKFPRIVPSSLATFGSDRFYEVYLAFSCYVLNKTIRKNASLNLLSRPIVTQENFSAAKEIVQLSTILSKEKFIDYETASYKNDLIWIKFAKNLSECLQKLKLLLKNNNELLKRNTMVLSNLYSTAPNEELKIENHVEKCLINLKRASEKRQTLEKFLSAEEKLWQYLASEIGENADSAVLNGQDNNIGVIDSLPEKFHVELGKVGFSTSEKDGKMSVIRYLQLLMAYIKSLKDLLSTNRSDLWETNVKDASFIEQDLHSINSLNKNLSEEIIPDLEESIKKLKLSHSFEDAEKNFESPLSQICSLPIMRYTPEAIKEQALLIDPGEAKLPLPSVENCPSNASSAYFSVSTNLSDVNTSRDETVRSAVSTTLLKANSGSKREDFFRESYSTENFVSLESRPSSSDFDISALSDIDFAPSARFKMRGSWLQEESLDAMTLPNVSFDD